MPHKGQIVAELENMVNERLFKGSWLAMDRATNNAIHKKFIALGLTEELNDGLGSCVNTPLGNELDARLFEVFVGHFDVWEVPLVLKDFGLINEAELMRCSIAWPKPKSGTRLWRMRRRKLFCCRT